MTKLRAWFTVGSFAFLGSAAALSCGGDDEATGNGGSGGGLLDGGGSGGMEGGVVRDADSSPTDVVGRRCITDAECGDGLICVARDDVDTLGGLGAPPGGLCTLACDSDDQCLEYSSNALCVPFTETESYCLEGCLVDAGLGTKCHSRPEFLCKVLDSASTATACQLSADCDPANNVICVNGRCTATLALCLPACGSDADCSDDLFCDPLTGFCVEDEPPGKGLNESCDPANDDTESDCASGICYPNYDNPDEGNCGGICNFFNPNACGYPGTGPVENACIFGSAFSGDDLEPGDMGFCGQLCDCDDNCSATGEVCISWEAVGAEALVDFWGRLGYCAPLVPESEGGMLTEADAIGPCAGGAPGMGGAGGAPGMGGAGGTPAPEGGAGGASAGAGGDG